MRVTYLSADIGHEGPPPHPSSPVAAMAQVNHQAEKHVESLQKARRALDEELDEALDEMAAWRKGEEDEKKQRATNI